MKWFLLGITGLLWIYTGFLLFDKEIKPFLEYKITPSYKTLLKGRIKAERKRATIYIGGKEAGNYMRFIKPKPNGSYEIQIKLDLDLPQIGVVENIKVSSIFSSIIDPEYRLESASATLNVKAGAWFFNMHISGKRVDDKLALFYSSPLGRGQKVIDLPKDTLLTDNFVPFQGSKFLAVGKKWRMECFDFNILEKKVGTTTLWCVVEEIEKYKTKQGEIPAYRIEIKRDPTITIPDHFIYVDMNGEVLEETFNIGKWQFRVVFER
jgi:hypothetical protein